MKRIQISLATLFWLTACVLLLTISIFERNRSARIESNSVAAPSHEHRAVLEVESELLNRQIQRHAAKTELAMIENSIDPNRGRPFRIASANLRNIELKLNRENALSAVLKQEAVSRMAARHRSGKCSDKSR